MSRPIADGRRSPASGEGSVSQEQWAWVPTCRWTRPQLRVDGPVMSGERLPHGPVHSGCAQSYHTRLVPRLVRSSRRGPLEQRSPPSPLGSRGALRWASHPPGACVCTQPLETYHWDVVVSKLGAVRVAIWYACRRSPVEIVMGLDEVWLVTGSSA